MIIKPGATPKSCPPGKSAGFGGSAGRQDCSWRPVNNPRLRIPAAVLLDNVAGHPKLTDIMIVSLQIESGMRTRRACLRAGRLHAGS